MRCNATLGDDIDLQPQFQSLLGFLMRCNDTVRAAFDFLAGLFQSLLGFLMRCNAAGRARHRRECRGFNPYWVF